MQLASRGWCKNCIMLHDPIAGGQVMRVSSFGLAVASLLLLAMSPAFAGTDGAPIPEPATIGLMGVSVAALLIAKSRRRK